MSWVDEYLGSAYVDGGRGEVVDCVRRYDCYGLARAVRHEVYGLPMLPAWGLATRHDLRLSASCYREQIAQLAECRPQPGALAAVLRGRLCTHVGVVVELDGLLAVMDTHAHTGPRWMRLADFERKYLQVVYYT